MKLLLKDHNYNILVVVRWPLGGIRTYMRYMFNAFPSKLSLTVLAASTQEDAALEHDVKEYGTRLVLINATGFGDFIAAVFRELQETKYDLLVSQGFMSALAVYFANIVFRIPHIVTIHGIVEPQYLHGKLAVLKRFMLRRALASATVLYGVSNDILKHVYDEFPLLKNDGPKPLVIYNGIKISDCDTVPDVPINLRNALNIANSCFLFGFFGRFMPQKGFDLIIEAVYQLCKRQPNLCFSIVAVGSGDYIREYQITIEKKGLWPFFYFLPFQPMVHHLYSQVDAIIMPSRWEASGLQAMEALCMGTPLIASNCIGLRETISDTPVFIFESENLIKLIEVMEQCLKDTASEDFKKYVPEARHRFNVETSANKLSAFITNLLTEL